MARTVFLLAGVLTVVGPWFLALRVGRWWTLATPWLLPLALLAWSYVTSLSEDPDECNEACAAAWLFVGALVAAVPAALGTAVAAVAVTVARRRRG